MKSVDINELFDFDQGTPTSEHDLFAAKANTVLDEIRNDLRRINPYWFLTGSLRFRCATTKSDIDVCFPISAKEDALKYLTSKCSKVKESNYNAGVKYELNGITINFVFLHPCDFVAWSKTAKVAELPFVMSNKGVPVPRVMRHGIHQMLVAIFKLTMGEHITSTNYREYL